MTKPELTGHLNVLSAIIRNLLPLDAHFVLVLAANATEAGGVDVHTSTAASIKGESLQTILGSVLAAIEGNPHAIQFGRITDLTPGGETS